MKCGSVAEISTQIVVLYYIIYEMYTVIYNVCVCVCVRFHFILFFFKYKREWLEPQWKTGIGANNFWDDDDNNRKHGCVQCTQNGTFFFLLLSMSNESAGGFTCVAGSVFVYYVRVYMGRMCEDEPRKMTAYTKWMYYATIIDV